MRRIVCLSIALLVCFSLACPALAAEDPFVPSISYKDGPELEDALLDGEDVGGCLVVTSILGAKNKSTDIYQEDRDLLLEVYEKLSDGSMKLPLENDEYVIRELVDVSFQKTACVEAAHGHKEALAQAGTTVTVTFDLGVSKNTEVVVMAFVDGEWAPIESVKNNGDGSVTGVFEDICPVAFCVEEAADTAAPRTGDEIGRQLPLWIALMAASLAAIVILLIIHRKNKR